MASNLRRHQKIHVKQSKLAASERAAPPSSNSSTVKARPSKGQKTDHSEDGDHPSASLSKRPLQDLSGEDAIDEDGFENEYGDDEGPFNTQSLAEGLDGSNHEGAHGYASSFSEASSRSIDDNISQNSSISTNQSGHADRGYRSGPTPHHDVYNAASNSNSNGNDGSGYHPSSGYHPVNKDDMVSTWHQTLREHIDNGSMLNNSNNANTNVTKPLLGQNNSNNDDTQNGHSHGQGGDGGSSGGQFQHPHQLHTNQHMFVDQSEPRPGGPGDPGNCEQETHPIAAILSVARERHRLISSSRLLQTHQ